MTTIDLIQTHEGRIARCNGWQWRVFNDAPDSLPRMRDIDGAERLQFKRPRAIRQLIKRIWPDPKSSGIYCRHTVERQSTGNGASREYTVEEYWLTEAQWLKVCARSETDVAEAILDDMIATYLAVHRRFEGEGVDELRALTQTHSQFPLLGAANAEHYIYGPLKRAARLRERAYGGEFRKYFRAQLNEIESISRHRHSFAMFPCEPVRLSDLVCAVKRLTNRIERETQPLLRTRQLELRNTAPRGR